MGGPAPLIADIEESVSRPTPCKEIVLMPQLDHRLTVHVLTTSMQVLIFKGVFWIESLH